LGHSLLEQLFDDPVIVEEKIDGSQFSFGKFNGELLCRSRQVTIDMDDTEHMFALAVSQARDLLPYLSEGWTYRTEYLSRPQHNTLKYNRVPKKNLILFDVDLGFEKYLSYENKVAAASMLGLECVPLLYKGKIGLYEELRNLFERESILGGPKVEGMVVKNYCKFGVDARPLMGKWVSEKFKEDHKVVWSNKNPSGKDFVTVLSESLATEARWRKAIQHLKECGEYTQSPKDIGKLIKEVRADIREECREEIKNKLFSWAWPNIQRNITKGLPEWYKSELVKGQFNV